MVQKGPSAVTGMTGPMGRRARFPKTALVKREGAMEKGCAAANANPCLAGEIEEWQAFDDGVPPTPPPAPLLAGEKLLRERWGYIRLEVSAVPEVARFYGIIIKIFFGDHPGRRRSSGSSLP